ncbi:LOW QUALITY PROTEIN: NACHT, LRR and PYD domains-containing protein 6 [Podargus strigoides]
MAPAALGESQGNGRAPPKAGFPLADSIAVGWRQESQTPAAVGAGAAVVPQLWRALLLRGSRSGRGCRRFSSSANAAAQAGAAAGAALLSVSFRTSVSPAGVLGTFLQFQPQRQLDLVASVAFSSPDGSLTPGAGVFASHLRTRVLPKPLTEQCQGHASCPGVQPQSSPDFTLGAPQPALPWQQLRRIPWSSRARKDVKCENVGAQGEELRHALKVKPAPLAPAGRARAGTAPRTPANPRAPLAPRCRGAPAPERGQRPRCDTGGTAALWAHTGILARGRVVAAVGALPMSGYSSRYRALSSGSLLRCALEDLSRKDFERFRDELLEWDRENGRNIPGGQLQEADCLGTKNLMVNAYGEKAALGVAITVFENCHLRDAAIRLQESQATDYRRDYRETIRQVFSRVKDRNARLGEGKVLDTGYLELVIVNKHRDEEQREHEIMAMGKRHREIMEEHTITVGDLFKPSPDGWTPKVVVLLGAAGVGKTMTARKIMLDWASDKMFMEFDYVFYIHCQEGNLLTRQASMEDLIAQCCRSSSPPLPAILGQPEKLLFVIDGFDELRFSFDRSPSELCSQPCEQKPVEIILSSLFHRSLLPESSLLITTRPAALRRLGRCLECERYAEILGFSEAERKNYFNHFFKNAEQADAAFQFIRVNETLFTMCLVPIVCWIVCTVMKQQLECSRGLTQSLKTTTGIYILYLSALLQSLSGRLKQGVPGVLRRLCCLAADGLWKQKVLFEEKEVQGYELDQREALPLLLNEHLFQRDISCVSTYSFIHLSFQEFFAALFYLLEEEGEVQDPPAGPCRDVKGLLESYGSSRNFFTLTVRFLFGLLNKKCRRKLEEMGCKIAPKVTQELLAWLQSRQKTALAILTRATGVIRELEVCHCLYELQDEQFIETALDPFSGVYLRGLNLSRFDQMVLSFSVQNFPKLESLVLRHCCFLRDDPEDCVGLQPAKKVCREEQWEEGKQSPIHLLCGAVETSGCKLKKLSFDRCQLTGACCGALASVLGANPTLTEVDLAGNEALRDGGVKLLCEGLRGGACQLQTLRLGCCSLTAAGCQDLAAVLGTLPSLVELDLSDNPLEDSGLRELCGALEGPGCGVQKLRLWRCRLTELSCRALAAVLPSSPSLAELHLGDNELGDRGVQQLSQALRDPACRLRVLRLWRCRLTELSCGALAAVLPSSPSLAELHLGDNELGDRGVQQLSQALRDPACRLRVLSLCLCQLSGACCEDLCAVLGTSRSLEHLDLSENDLGDVGVQRLCEGLGHPCCSLQRLWLKNSGLNKETLQKLDALKGVKPSLNIGYI